MSASRYIVGLHEGSILDQHDRGEALMAARPGPLVFTELIGTQTLDYSRYTDRGHPVLVRINWSYGTGTLPVPALYSYFAAAVAETARHIVGAITGIIFCNEPNHPAESPTAGQAITALQYAAAFRLAYAALEAARPDLSLFVAGIAPWAAVAEPPDWIEYLDTVLVNCGSYDGIVLHTYTHRHDRVLIASEQTMDPPYGARRYEFRAYRDFMAVIPAGTPVYITEANPGANPDSPRWENINNGWCQAAAGEIDGWNQAHLDHQVRGLAFFRYPEIDSWRMADKPALLADVQAAIERGYEWMDGGQPVANVLANPSLELPYVVVPGHDNCRVANGWTAWAQDHQPPDVDIGGAGGCAYPEYKESPRALDAQRVLDGESAQCWFLTSNRMNAGIYQRSSVGMGAECNLSAHVQTWCTNSEDKTGPQEEMYARVGIDPLGRLDQEAAGIVWCQWTRVTAAYAQIAVQATAQAAYVTAYVQFWNKWAMKHNDAYVDKLEMTISGVTPPTPPGPIYEDGEALIAYAGTLETVAAGLRDIATRVGSGADPRVGQLIDTAVADLTEARGLV